MFNTIFTIPNELNLSFLDSETSFEQLSLDEKLYAYAMYKASWAGSLIVARQTSPESERLIRFFTMILRETELNKLLDLNDSCIKHFLNYVTMLFGNLGNYLSFGDSKFIPQLTEEQFKNVIIEYFPPYYNMYLELEHSIFSLDSTDKYLGYPPQITTYFSQNMSEDECKMVDRYLTHIKLEGWNTRCYKETVYDKIRALTKNQFVTVNENGLNALYVVSIASAYDPSIEQNVENFEGYNFLITYQDHQNELKEIVKYLHMAIPYANSTQQKMINSYMWHFKYGNINDHKESQKIWVTDKGPAVETNIGFIENYRDPSGIRSEFESFVSIVDKEKTKKFKRLVDNSNTFIQMLPWNQRYGSTFEKDTFLAPDFTALDVVTFVTSGLPAGINIPNYDEIRQTIGFKNVSLDNVIRTGYKTTELPKYLSVADGQIYNTYAEKAFAIDVAGHELFGHGSGKLFTELSGQFNFDTNLINPITNQQISTWYKDGETWSSKFGKLSSSYEECRAECVGLFLASFPEIHQVFEYPGEEFEDISYTSWLWMIRAGILGISAYNLDKKEFTQAHSRARYVIYKVLEEASVLKIEFNELENDFIINVNRELIPTVGLSALTDFLVKLNIFKATADYENAKILFDQYSFVSDYNLKIKEICENNQKPRTMYIQPTLKLAHNNVEYVKYNNQPIDFIKSFLDKNIC